MRRDAKPCVCVCMCVFPSCEERKSSLRRCEFDRLPSPREVALHKRCNARELGLHVRQHEQIGNHRLAIVSALVVVDHTYDSATNATSRIPRRAYSKYATTIRGSLENGTAVLTRSL